MLEFKQTPGGSTELCIYKLVGHQKGDARKKINRHPLRADQHTIRPKYSQVE